MHCFEQSRKDVAPRLTAIDLPPLRPASCNSAMVEKIQTLLVLLGIIGVLAVVAERVRFPFPILLVIAGLFIALFPGSLSGPSQGAQAAPCPTARGQSLCGNQG
ncbi:MAG: hypothetical protein WBV90_16640 [Terrimicrobiaceae bacterium]